MDNTIIEAIKTGKATLIDLRNADELEENGSISTAKHIPLMEVPENLEDIKNFPTPVVLFCRSGGRADRAKEFLTHNGLSEVYNAGGYVDVKEILEG